MELNNYTKDTINKILLNEIGVTIEKLNTLSEIEQRKILEKRYNGNKIKHFKLGEKVFSEDGTYILAGMYVKNKRRKLNKEFDKVFYKKMNK